MNEDANGLVLLEALKESSDKKKWDELQSLGGLLDFAMMSYTGGPYDVRHERRAELDTELNDEFKRKLRTGELTATGCDSRSPLDRREIPRELWQFLETDFMRGRAQGDGFVITAILVKACPSLARAEGTIRVTRDCRSWLQEKAETLTQIPKKQELYEQAKKDLGNSLSWREFSRLWGELAPASWKAPGRKS